VKWPLPYPRIEHMSASSSVSRDDLVLVHTDVQALLSDVILVEEKLDGANVMLWRGHRGTVEVATRGGPGAIDRAGQLGPLKAWATQREDVLRAVLLSDRVLYAEWLWFQHSVRYERLPDYLIGLDVLERSGRWLDVEERDAALREAGLTPPPRLWQGTIESSETLMELLGVSRYGEDVAEGLIVRPVQHRPDIPRAAKVVRSSLRLRSDESWAHEVRRNHLARDTPHAA
jgi:RNA ligase